MYPSTEGGGGGGGEGGAGGCGGQPGSAGGCTKPPPPPPLLQTPPKFSNPSFSNLRFWGKGSKIFLPFLRGFFLPHVSIFKILRILSRFQKCLKNTENFLTPDLTSGSDLG